jgi:hypothetical protein
VPAARSSTQQRPAPGFSTAVADAAPEPVKEAGEKSDLGRHLVAGDRAVRAPRD